MEIFAAAGVIAVLAPVREVFTMRRNMSAKPKKGGAKPASSSPAPTPVAVSAGAAAPAAESVAWIDSPDPRKRKLGQIVLVVVWVYVAALWLLALDQTFHWGIFGPKVPPLP